VTNKKICTVANRRGELKLLYRAIRFDLLHHKWKFKSTYTYTLAIFKGWYIHNRGSEIDQELSSLPN